LKHRGAVRLRDVNKKLAKTWGAIAREKPELLDDLDLQQRVPRKKPVKREAPIQQRIVVYLRKHLPPGSLVWSNNASFANKQHGFASRATGTLAGLPDVFALVGGNLYGIEVKAHGGRCSDVQREMHLALSTHSVPCCVVTDANGAVTFLQDMGVEIK